MIRKIKISSISVNDNRRSLDMNVVNSLMESIQTIGLLNPITVNNENELLAGRHRLEACKLLGYTEIESNSIGGNYLDFALAEIDENLLRNELTTLERADSLAKRKEIYEEMHPETKNGANVQNLKHVKDTIDFAENANSRNVDSFVENTSKMINQSPRAIYQDLEISKNLDNEVKELIRNEPIADKKTELLKLSKEKPEKQKEIAEKIVKQEIKKVDEYYQEEPEPIHIKDYDVQELKDELITVLNAYKTTKSIKCLEIIKTVKNYLSNI